MSQPELRVLPEEAQGARRFQAQGPLEQVGLVELRVRWLAVPTPEPMAQVVVQNCRQAHFLQVLQGHYF